MSLPQSIELPGPKHSRSGRKFAARLGSTDGRGQCDIGGVDPRPTGAMALCAPTLAGLAATIARRNGGSKNHRRDPNRAPIFLAIRYGRARTPLASVDPGPTPESLNHRRTP